jgi:hypothetical protein
MLASDPSAGTPRFVNLSDMPSPAEIDDYTYFDRMAFLSVAILQLPRNQNGLRNDSYSPGHSPAVGSGTGTGTDSDMEADPSLQKESEDRFDLGPRGPSYHDTLQTEEHIVHLFNDSVSLTYLALHHTPLLDLLAVAGDSWLFTQKVLSSTLFRENKRRLRAWVEQHPLVGAPTSNPHHGAGNAAMSAARATAYASQAILAFLARETGALTPTATRRLSSTLPMSALAPWSHDLSDYWAMYVCALIIWAFCHRATRGSSSDNGAGSSGGAGGGGGGGSSPSLGSSSRPAGSPTTGSGLSTTAADEEAMRWLRQVASVPVAQAELGVRAMRGRGGAAVVSLVRRRLEWDCVGKRSMLYSDALGVLRRLETDVQYRMF